MAPTDKEKTRAKDEGRIIHQVNTQYLQPYKGYTKPTSYLSYWNICFCLFKLSYLDQRLYTATLFVVAYNYLYSVNILFLIQALFTLNLQVALFRDLLLDVGGTKDGPALRENLRNVRMAAVEAIIKAIKSNAFHSHNISYAVVYLREP